MKKCANPLCKNEVRNSFHKTKYCSIKCKYKVKRGTKKYRDYHREYAKIWVKKKWESCNELESDEYIKKRLVAMHVMDLKTPLSKEIIEIKREELKLKRKIKQYEKKRNTPNINRTPRLD